MRCVRAHTLWGRSLTSRPIVKLLPAELPGATELGRGWIACKSLQELVQLDTADRASLPMRLFADECGNSCRSAMLIEARRAPGCLGLTNPAPRVTTIQGESSSGSRSSSIRRQPRRPDRLFRAISGIREALAMLASDHVRRIKPFSPTTQIPETPEVM